MLELQQIASHFPDPNPVITEISGRTGMVASFLLSGIGLPFQIYRTYKTGEKLSPILSGVALFSYSCWATYGYFKPDVYLAVAQTPGVIFTTVILVQSLVSKKK